MAESPVLGLTTAAPCRVHGALRMDRSLFRQANHLAARTGWLHGPAAAFANYGIVLFAVLLVLAWWRARSAVDLRGEAGAVWAGSAALIALGLGQVIATLVDRSRPYETVSSVQVLISRTTDSSFPSDHATAAGAVAAGLWLTDRTVGRWAIAGALLMASVRVYAGVHYPSDVVAGLALGTIVALVGAKPCTDLGETVLRRLARVRRFAWLLGTQERSLNGRDPAHDHTGR